MTDTTGAAGQLRAAETLATTIEAALRESLPAWWQTPPRLDWAALAVARQLLGTTEGEGEPAEEQEPIPLRWGLDDVMYGDDDTTTILLSGPDREPYWVELDPERTTALRDALAGPTTPPAPADRAATGDQWSALLDEVADRMKPSWFTDEATAATAKATIRRLADEAAAGVQPPTTSETDTEPLTEEQIIREHVTTVHLISDQLEAVESWLWERLADTRNATKTTAPAAPEEPTPDEAEETK